MRTRPVRTKMPQGIVFREDLVDVYWLNERQALYLVQLLRTPASKEMNKKHNQRPGEALRLFRTGARRGDDNPCPKLRPQHQLGAHRP